MPNPLVVGGSFSVAERKIAFSGVPNAASSEQSLDFNVSFKESGLPAQLVWFVAFNGSTEFSSGRIIGFSAPNGTYPFGVGPVTGYSSSPTTGVVTVNGSAISKTIKFVSTAPPATFSVTFTAVGLPAQTVWEVALNGTVDFAATNSLVFAEPNGSYSFGVFPVTGYTIQPALGTVKVNGTNYTQQVDFGPIPGGGTTSGSKFLGLPQTEGYALLGGVIFLIILVALFALLRARPGGPRGPPPRPNTPPASTPLEPPPPPAN
ncbi:MAG: hypothetical protein ACLP8Y_03505 [Thermoplasmata archaeon]